ncbi:MAG: N4-gp56 family major capsid protein [Oscillibacter sp.]|nr:N4-gp56 family major capsid protein [Oscillibacter sp.]
MPTATVNLAAKYAPKVDERFARASQAALALNNDYSFQGVRTVNVYSIPTVPLNDYNRTAGANRYGSPTNLTNEVQELQLSRDRSFAFIIDRADKTQTQMTMDSGRALAREVREVVIPEYDRYAFWKLAKAAADNGQTATTAATKANAYELFLAAQEALGDANVPDSGRVCFCSYRFANLLKQDPAFMIQSQRSKEMVDKGIVGEVDGVRVVRVPASRLPVGAAFILTHPVAACGPKQLNEHKTHDNPPGISGWLVEGRMLYDVFVLNNKKNAIFYHGTAPAATFTEGAANPTD